MTRSPRFFIHAGHAKLYVLFPRTSSFLSFEIRSRYFFSPLLPGIYQRCNACATLTSILINWNKKRMTSSDGGRELVSIESTSNEPSEILRTDVRTKWTTTKKEIRTTWRRISVYLNFCQEKENFELVERLRQARWFNLKSHCAFGNILYIWIIHIITNQIRIGKFENKEYVSLMSTNNCIFRVKKIARLRQSRKARRYVQRFESFVYLEGVNDLSHNGG